MKNGRSVHTILLSPALWVLLRLDVRGKLGLLDSQRKGKEIGRLGINSLGPEEA